MRAGTLVAPGPAMLALAATAAAGMLSVPVMVAAVSTSPPASAPTPAALADIPADYLAAYQSAAARFKLGAEGWSVLAAIGKVESDHGRSPAPGVRSGQNFHGCCAGPMQIHNGFGSGGGTWGAFRVDGDGDERMDIYDPEDAVHTGARYLAANGAPGDWRRSIFAYNHSASYVADVEAQAARYRQASATDAVPETHVAPVATGWLAPLPGHPGERCDVRIVADVVALVRAFGIRVTDCFGGAPHALNGEHPLGLAIDAVPADGDWRRTLRLVTAFGWRAACAARGCPGAGPFRVLLYNGFPGHGDPQYTTTAHLHVSWDHAPARPFTQAAWVRTLISPTTPKGAKR